MRMAADSSSMIAFLSGARGADVSLVTQAMEDDALVLPFVVRMEILSAPKITADIVRDIRVIPLLSMDADFWDRAAELRRLLLRQKLKAKLGDTLIAQSCIDHGVALITRDGDFRHFAKHGGLKLAC